jgi:hypothetical protein
VVSCPLIRLAISFAFFHMAPPRRLFMLALPTVLEIDRLLREGSLSQREIAGQLGVSRGSVAAIASGRRAPIGRLPLVVGGFARRRHSACPERCRQCGHRVYLPCLICLTRSYEELQKRPQTSVMDFALKPARAKVRYRGRTLRRKITANSAIPTTNIKANPARASLFPK